MDVFFEDNSKSNSMIISVALAQLDNETANFIAAADNELAYFYGNTTSPPFNIYTPDTNDTNVVPNRTVLGPVVPRIIPEVPIWLIPCYSIILLFAVVGNLLVISTLVQNRRMRTVTNLFLLNLAISDILLGVLCMPVTLVGTLLRHFIFGEFFCKLIQFSQATSVAVSSWTLVAISCERYYAICHPLRSRSWQTISHAYRIIAFIWSGSMVCMSPIFIFSQLRPTSRQGLRKCREQWPEGSLGYERSYNIFLDLVLLVLPLIILCVAYILITRTLYVGMKYERAMIFGNTTSRLNTAQTSVAATQSNHHPPNSTSLNFSVTFRGTTNRWRNTNGGNENDNGNDNVNRNSNDNGNGNCSGNDNGIEYDISSDGRRNTDGGHCNNNGNNRELKTEQRHQMASFMLQQQHEALESQLQLQQQRQSLTPPQHQIKAQNSHINSRSNAEVGQPSNKRKLLTTADGRRHLCWMRSESLKSLNRVTSTGQARTLGIEGVSRGVVSLLPTPISSPSTSLNIAGDSSQSECVRVPAAASHHRHQTVERRKSNSTPSLRIAEAALRRSNEAKNYEGKKRVVKMLFVLVLEFFICWTPLYVINTVAMFIGSELYEYVDYTSISFFQLLAYSSSCCNPITYCFMNAGFRRAFLDTFRGLHLSGGHYWRKRSKTGTNLSVVGNSITIGNSVTMLSQNTVLESPRL